MILQIFIFQNSMDELTNNLLSWWVDTNTTVNNLLSWSIDPNSTINTFAGTGGMFSGFTIETIIVGVIASIIWAYYLKIGRKNGKATTILCGIALLGITYFVHDVWYLIGTSLVIALIPIIKK